MPWILVGGSVMSAWSILRLLGHERAQVLQDLEAERAADEAQKNNPPTPPSTKPNAR